MYSDDELDERTTSDEVEPDQAGEVLIPIDADPEDYPNLGTSGDADADQQDPN